MSKVITTKEQREPVDYALAHKGQLHFIEEKGRSRFADGIEARDKE